LQRALELPEGLHELDLELLTLEELPAPLRVRTSGNGDARHAQRTGSARQRGGGSRSGGSARRGGGSARHRGQRSDGPHARGATGGHGSGGRARRARRG
jgi:hypothetical protein